MATPLPLIETSETGAGRLPGDSTRTAERSSTPSPVATEASPSCNGASTISTANFAQRTLMPALKQAGFELRSAARAGDCRHRTRSISSPSRARSGGRSQSETGRPASLRSLPVTLPMRRSPRPRCVVTEPYSSRDHQP